jgi:hypothetical protein
MVLWLSCRWRLIQDSFPEYNIITYVSLTVVLLYHLTVMKIGTISKIFKNITGVQAWKYIVNWWYTIVLAWDFWSSPYTSISSWVKATNICIISYFSSKSMLINIWLLCRRSGEKHLVIKIHVNVIRLIVRWYENKSDERMCMAKNIPMNHSLCRHVGRGRTIFPFPLRYGVE